jgi:hypothetical protein
VLKQFARFRFVQLGKSPQPGTGLIVISKRVVGRCHRCHFSILAQGN